MKRGIIFSLVLLLVNSAFPNPRNAIWTLVRRQSSSLNFHPATDNALGTESYGSPVAETGVGTFSLVFEDAVPGWDEALFITGDRSRWMIMNRTEISKMGGAGLVGAPFTITTSYLSPTGSSSAIMFNRGLGSPEDPWFSPIDHGPAIASENLLYGEASFAAVPSNLLSLTRNGLNVFVRKSSDQILAPDPVNPGVPSPNDPDWTLVRRQSSSLNFHPATDNALGTESYGSPVAETGVGTFSLVFEDAVPGWDEALFVTGDRSRWMIMNRTEISKMGGAGPVGAPFALSASYLTPTEATSVIMFNRPLDPEDPWLSPVDHYTAIQTGNLLYGEASFNSIPSALESLRRNGLNVFIRKSSARMLGTE